MALEMSSLSHPMFPVLRRNMGSPSVGRQMDGDGILWTPAQCGLALDICPMSSVWRWGVCSSSPPYFLTYAC